MKRVPLILAVSLAAAFAVFFSWFDIGRHAKTNSSRFDLGNIEQLEWNLVHGHGFVSTDPYGTATISRFAFHADTLLVVLAPFYALWPRAETLLVLQALIVSSGAVAMYILGRKWLSPWWGAVFSFLYVINPAIQWATIFDFHAVTLVTALIPWAVWAAVERKYRTALILICVAMMAKEEIGLLLPVIGLFVWFKQKQKTWGKILTLVPLVWSVSMLLLVLPQYRQLSAGNDEVYRTIFGDGAASIIKGAAVHPLTFVRVLFARQNLLMARQLLLSFGGLSIFSWWSLAAVPEYVINALSLKPAQHLLLSHYTSGLTPWLEVGALVTTSWVTKRFTKKLVPILLGAWLVGMAVFSAWWLGPLPGAKMDDSKVVLWRNDYASVVRAWEKKIPSSASVSVTNNIGAHFARRQDFYSFPLGVDQSDYVVVLTDHTTPVVASQDEVTGRLQQLLTDGAWQQLDHQGDFVVLKRK